MCVNAQTMGWTVIASYTHMAHLISLANKTQVLSFDGYVYPFMGTGCVYMGRIGYFAVLKMRPKFCFVLRNKKTKNKKQFLPGTRTHCP